MITDGEFYTLFSRYLQKQYKGPDGMPGLTSNQLIKPQKRVIVNSAGASWTRFYVNRAVYVWTPDFRQIDFISGENPGDLSADTSKPWNKAGNGVAKLYTPGEWHLKTPLLAGDVEGTGLVCLMSDAALGIDAGNLTPSDIAGSSVAAPLNLTKIGGTDQTALDFTGKFAPRTPIAPGAAVAVTNVSGLKLAARVGRKFLYYYVENFAGGCTMVTVSFATPVISKRGQKLYTDDWRSFDATTGMFETAVYAITDAGTADIYFVEAT